MHFHNIQDKNGIFHRAWVVNILIIALVFLLNACVGSYYSAENLEQEAKSYAQQGDQHFQKRDWSKAADSYSKAISGYKDFYSECKFAPDCRVKTGPFKHNMSILAARRGMSKYFMKDYSGAESDASLSIDYDEFEPGGHTLMGMVYLKYKEPDNAKKEYQKLLNMTTNSALSVDAKHRARIGANSLKFQIWGK